MKGFLIVPTLVASWFLATKGSSQVWDGEDLSLSSTGGTVTTSNLFLSIAAPAGAVASKTTISIRPNRLAPYASARFLSPAMSITSGETKLSKPVTLSYYYNLAELPTGLTEASARLYKVVGHHWVLVPSSVNTATHQVSAVVSSLGTFAVLATTATVPPENAIIYMNQVDGQVFRYFPDQDVTQYLTTLRVSDGTLIISPTEDQVAFAHDLANGFDINAANIDHSGVHKLSTITVNNATNGAISPDGSYGVFSAQVGSAWGVYKFSMFGGPSTLVAAGGSTGGPTFSEDGTKVAYADNTTITVRSSTTGALIKTLTPGGTAIDGLSFNPAGTILSFNMVQPSSGNRFIYVEPVASGGALKLTGAIAGRSRCAWNPTGTTLAAYVPGYGVCLLSASIANQTYVVTIPTQRPVDLIWR